MIGEVAVGACYGLKCRCPFAAVERVEAEHVLVEVVKVLDFEVRFAVAGDGWHAEAGTIENRDAEAFHQ